MTDQKIKLRQFVAGEQLEELISRTDTTVYNLVPNTYQLVYSETEDMIVEDYFRADYTTTKAVVNGATYFEEESFLIDINNKFQWIDTEYKLRENDLIIVEWLINAATQKAIVLEAADGLLYLVIDNKLLVVQEDGVDYPMCIEITSDGTYGFYTSKTGKTYYYKISEDGSITEVPESQISSDTFLTEPLKG